MKWAAVDALRVASGLAPQQPPSGAFTIAEYETRYKCSDFTAKRHLRRLVEGKKLATGLFRSGSATRRYYWKP
jgi:hypothetical protein